MRTDAEILMNLRDQLEDIVRSSDSREVKKARAVFLKLDTASALHSNGVSPEDAEDLMRAVAMDVHAKLIKEAT